MNEVRHPTVDQYPGLRKLKRQTSSVTIVWSDFCELTENPVGSPVAVVTIGRLAELKLEYRYSVLMNKPGGSGIDSRGTESSAYSKPLPRNQPLYLFAPTSVPVATPVAEETKFT